MYDTLDIILTVGALVAGVLLLTGHGSFLMGGGNREARKNLYNEKKMERASGVALIAIGIATGVDHFMQHPGAKLVYIGAMLIIMVLLVVYIRTKCKK